MKLRNKMLLLSLLVLCSFSSCAVNFLTISKKNGRHCTLRFHMGKKLGMPDSYFTTPPSYYYFNGERESLVRKIVTGLLSVNGYVDESEMTLFCRDNNFNGWFEDTDLLVSSVPFHYCLEQAIYENDLKSVAILEDNSNCTLKLVRNKSSLYKFQVNC